jgi:hypothetical protein
VITDATENIVPIFLIAFHRNYVVIWSRFLANGLNFKEQNVAHIAIFRRWVALVTNLGGQGHVIREQISHFWKLE